MTFKSAENLRNQFGEPTNCYFILSCEGTTKETLISENPDHFRVDKTFNFPIKTGQEPLVITMLDSSKTG